MTRLLRPLVALALTTSGCFYGNYGGSYHHKGTPVFSASAAPTKVASRLELTAWREGDAIRARLLERELCRPLRVGHRVDEWVRTARLDCNGWVLTMALGIGFVVAPICMAMPNYRKRVTKRTERFEEWGALVPCPGAPRPVRGRPVRLAGLGIHTRLQTNAAGEVAISLFDRVAAYCGGDTVTVSLQDAQPRSDDARWKQLKEMEGRISYGQVVPSRVVSALFDEESNAAKPVDEVKVEAHAGPRRLDGLYGAARARAIECEQAEASSAARREKRRRDACRSREEPQREVCERNCALERQVEHCHFGRRKCAARAQDQGEREFCRVSFDECLTAAKVAPEGLSRCEEACFEAHVGRVCR